MSQTELFLHVIAAFGFILATTGACGWVLQHLGQPKVVGEMIGGILLGSSLFGLVAPEAQASAFDGQVKQALFLFSHFGLAIYMFLVGCEMDMNTFSRRTMARAATLSLVGIVPSLLLGGAVGYAFHGVLGAGQSDPLLFALYLGSALSITAFPVLARILEEKHLTASPLGALALTAASIDDALAWCLLALVAALSQAGSNMFTGLRPLIGGLVFAAACFLLLRPLLRSLARRVEQRGHLVQNEFAWLLLLLLGVIWAADTIGIDSVFGAFIFGVALPRSPVLLSQLRAHLHPLVSALFLPLFFASTGLTTNIEAIFAGQLVVVFLIVLFTAFFVKYVCCTLAMRGMGYGWGEASAIGGLFNARGLMLLLFANVGLAHDLIDMRVFSLLVMVAVITTGAATPIFTASLRRATPEVRVPTGPTVVAPASADAVAK